jgi:lysophospholipase L1-like esterase
MKPSVVMTKIHLLVFFFFTSQMIQSQPIQSAAEWANFSKYAAENEALLKTTTAQKRIVFMGNSITEGWKTADSSFFSSNPYINRGIGGQTSSQMLLRFRRDVIQLKPFAVVILAGVNDIAQNAGPIAVEDVFNNIVSMAELAKANQIKVILCSVLPAIDFSWRPGLEPADKIIALNKMIQEYCIKHKVVYVDYFTTMVDHRKGLNERYGNDGVHPNLAGYKVMEPLVEKGIAEVMKNR